MVKWTRAVTVGLFLGGALCLQTQRAGAQTKAEFGMRVGYGMPFGKLSQNPGKGVEELMTGQIPIGLELGARIAGHVFVGGYLSYGLGILNQQLVDLCDRADAEAQAQGLDHSCHGQDVRLGIEGLYHVAAPGTSIDPWFGVGAGLEWLSFTESLSNGVDAASVSVAASGFEFLALQAGVDFPVSPVAALGPFVTFTLGQYGSASTSCTGDCGTETGFSSGIHGKALHEWLMFGLRGAVAF